MSELFKKFWRDPVWSKVIAAAILAGAGLLWPMLRELPSWAVALGHILFIPIPLWIVGCLLLLVSAALLFRNVRLPKRQAMLPTTSIVRPARIPARLRVSIRFPDFERDPTRIAIIIQNTGGTDVLHFHISDVHIFQKTARFPKDIESIPVGTSTVELQPVIIEYPESIAHDMPGAMYEASRAGANIRNNDAFDYQGEASFYDPDGNQFRALWRYTFYPKKYFVARNPPTAKYPDHEEKIDLGPFLVVSDVGIEKVAEPRYPEADRPHSASAAIHHDPEQASAMGSPKDTSGHGEKGDIELTIPSPNDFVIKITRDQGTAKGLMVTAYNHRLDPVSHVFITVRTAQSFDSHHQRFRNSSNFNAIRIDLLDVIQPSAKGRNTWFVRKELDKPHLFVGNDFSHEMIWPDMDNSEVQKWLLSVGIRAQTAPRDASQKATVFAETMHHVIVIWESDSNEFFVRKADVSEATSERSVRS